MTTGFEGFADIIKNKQTKKAPAHPWQDLALRVITDLKIPNFKRGAVFKVCKENKKEFVEQALNDTKELCQAGQKWKYFFKIIGDRGNE
jgi:hypothetical protein